MERWPRRRSRPGERSRARPANSLLLAVASGAFAMSLFVSLLGLFSR